MIKTELALHTLRKAVERYELGPLARESGQQSVGILSVSTADAELSPGNDEVVDVSDQRNRSIDPDTPLTPAVKPSRKLGRRENGYWLPLTAPSTTEIFRGQMSKLQLDVKEIKEQLKDVQSELQALKSMAHNPPEIGRPTIAQEVEPELQPKFVEGVEEDQIEIEKLREIEHDEWKGIGNEHRMT